MLAYWETEYEFEQMMEQMRDFITIQSGQNVVQIASYVGILDTNGTYQGLIAEYTNASAYFSAIGDYAEPLGNIAENRIAVFISQQGTYGIHDVLPTNQYPHICMKGMGGFKTTVLNKEKCGPYVAL